MLLAGYSKFVSKKGNPLCVVHFLIKENDTTGKGYRPFKDEKGSVDVWANPDIKIDDDMIFSECEPIFKINEKGFRELCEVRKKK